VILPESLSKSESESVVDPLDDAVDEANCGLDGIRPVSPSLDVSDPEPEQPANNVLTARRFREVIRDGEHSCLVIIIG
jgi:hypothetical protein